jgi:hypothetical protein
MAPELLLPEDHGFERSTPSKAGDIYAIGMVIYEVPSFSLFLHQLKYRQVMTGTIPFNELADTAAMLKVTSGVRPERPTHAEVIGLTDGVWGLMEACWNQKWNERPAVSTVLSRLNEASRDRNPPPLTTASIRIESYDSDSDASSLISGTMILL